MKTCHLPNVEGNRKTLSVLLNAVSKKTLTFLASFHIMSRNNDGGTSGDLEVVFFWGGGWTVPHWKSSDLKCTYWWQVMSICSLSSYMSMKWYPFCYSIPHNCCPPIDRLSATQSILEKSVRRKQQTNTEIGFTGTALQGFPHLSAPASLFRVGLPSCYDWEEGCENGTVSKHS